MEALAEPPKTRPRKNVPHTEAIPCAGFFPEIGLTNRDRPSFATTSIARTVAVFTEMRPGGVNQDGFASSSRPRSRLTPSTVILDVHTSPSRQHRHPGCPQVTLVTSHSWVSTSHPQHRHPGCPQITLARARSCWVSTSHSSHSWVSTNPTNPHGRPQITHQSETLPPRWVSNDRSRFCFGKETRGSPVVIGASG